MRENSSWKEYIHFTSGPDLCILLDWDISDRKYPYHLVFVIDHWSMLLGDVMCYCHPLVGRLSCSNDVRSMRVTIAAQDMLEHQLWPVTGHTFQDILLISSSLGVP